MSTTRSQAEIVGFLVLMVLVVIGILFFITRPRSDSSDTKSDLLDSTMNQAALDSLLTFESSCGSDGSSLISNCIEDNLDCAQQPACAVAGALIKDYLDTAYGKVKKPYSFRAGLGAQEKIKVDSDYAACTSAMEKTGTGIAVIASKKGNILITLDTC